MTLRLVITVLCGVGLYAALFMLRKTARARRGELAEPSVVQSGRARLFGGIPNALLGAVYYPAFGIAVWFVDRPWQIVSLLIISLVAASVSCVLAYSLLFVTRMPCIYCWTSHAVNWTLALCYAYFSLSALGVRR